MDRAEKRNRQMHNYSWELQHSLSTTDITCRQKISKDIEELSNNTINQNDIIDIYRTLHPKQHIYFKGP